MKVVVNRCFGGFGLSEKAKALLPPEFDEYDKANRSDPKLVEVVEKLGEEANGSCAKLEVVEIPDDVKWGIAEYDGQEWVAEDHRTW